MNPIVIRLKENNGISRQGEPVRLGIPLPQNSLLRSDQLSLEHPNNNELILGQFKPLAYWPDGSIRWLLACFLSDLDANQSLAITLRKTGKQVSSDFNNNASQSADGLCINTTQNQFVVATDALSWQLNNDSSKVPRKTYIQLTTPSGVHCDAQLDNGWTVTEQGNVFTAIQATGRWLQADQAQLARFDCTLRFYQHSATVEVELCIHNPNRAKHSGGLWDLGDEGSVHFRALTVNIETGPCGQGLLETNANDALITATTPDQPIKIYQDSSGGKHWDSKNHINGEQIPTTQFQGYRFYNADTADTVDEIAGRASPIMHWQQSESSVQAHLQQFWQNFPSSMTCDQQALSIGLFPEDSKFPHELQGGERKTQTCYINYSDKQSALHWARAPLTPILDSKQYEAAEAFPWFNASQPAGAMDQLISAGLDGDSNFFAKREIIDEYSWRDFGDIFADHETLYQQSGDSPYISHYNNQYDAVYGFARQFALSGDPRWSELMNDLARHVADIDIYHTDQDRAEYNHGLFWHTDHYLDAHTATHRTYTRHNDTSSIPGQTGGGPAAEHCYTSGLLYHYFLTGTEASRQAVLDLANWMVANHEGNGGILEQLLAIKKQELPKLKALLRGERPSPHRYPFTRGTGNYLNAVLDAWHMTGEQAWIDKAEAIINDTIHPADDLKQRDLLNAEVAWSYLILLLSIAKYLGLKQQHQQYDSHYQFALDAFSHYTRWMLDHEQPFLSKPEQLEFPNDTWAAQDIRKAMLMFIAAQFDPTLSDRYLTKAQEWMSYVTDKLKTSPEGYNARVLVILMQNYGPQHSRTIDPSPQHPTKHHSLPSKLSLLTIICRISTRLYRGISNFSLSKERAWLKIRVEK